MDGLEVRQTQPCDLSPEGRFVERSLHGIGGSGWPVQIPDNVIVFDCLGSGLRLTLNRDVPQVVSDADDGSSYSADRSAVTEVISKVPIFNDVCGDDYVGTVDFLISDRLSTAAKSKHQHRTSDRAQPHFHSPAFIQR